MRTRCPYCGSNHVSQIGVTEDWKRGIRLRIWECLDCSQYFHTKQTFKPKKPI